MPFIGNKPSAVPLTSADIADSIITSAKIVDGSILNADINASSAIAISKIASTGTSLQVLRMNTGATALEFATVSSGFTSGTAVATTSGTSIDFTGIPSGVTEITVLFKGVSTNGSSAISIQIGNGSIVTTGYTSIGGGGNASAFTNAQFTNGFVLMDSFDATWNLIGYYTLKAYGNNWFIHGGAVRDTVYASWAYGGKTLSGTLDRIRITTTGGSNTFDAGEVNITYL